MASLKKERQEKSDSIKVPLLDLGGEPLNNPAQIDDGNGSQKYLASRVGGGTGRQTSEVAASLRKFQEQFQKDHNDDAYLRDKVVDEQEVNLNKVSDEEVQQLNDQNQTAAMDATGCQNIQSLGDFLEQQQDAIEPKKQFFELQDQYYNENNFVPKETTTMIHNLRNQPSHIIDLQMEIVSTEKEQVPILKSVEWNTQSQTQKIIKIIKFYDFEKNEIKKQFNVDEFIMPSNLAKSMFEISILHFQNFIFFFKRDENNDRRLVLQCINVNTLEANVIPYFSLDEPPSSDWKFNPIFSREFGGNDRSFKTKEEFLSNQFIFCQLYRIDENSRTLEHGHMWGYHQINSTLQKFNSRDYQEIEVLKYPIQNVCHTRDKNMHIFVAHDSFYTYQFEVTQDLYQSGYSKYFGANEFHAENERQYLAYEEAKNDEDIILTDDDKKVSILRDFIEEKTLFKNFHPFMKYQHTQFIVECCEVEYMEAAKMKKEKKQYYTLTNDNQYMLVYPNYSDNSQQIEVLQSIARQNNYSQLEADGEYDYMKDLVQRLEDYQTKKYRKVCHVNNNPKKNCNRFKKTQHLRNVLGGDVDQQLRTGDVEQSIILSVNPRVTQIYVFCNRPDQQDYHRVCTFTYLNNIAVPAKTSRLEKEVDNVQQHLIAYYGEQRNERKQAANNYSYYLNSTYRDVISHSHFIKTDKEDKSQFVFKEHKNSFFFVEDKKSGLYHSVRMQRESQLPYRETVVLQFYNKNKHWYVFFFTLTSEKNKLNKQHTWFAVRKSYKEMKDVYFQDQSEAILDTETNTKITLFNENLNNLPTEQENIDKYVSNEYTYRDLIEGYTWEPAPGSKEWKTYVKPEKPTIIQKGQDQLVNLTFEKVVDNKVQNIDFVPIIYQKQNNSQTHFLIMLNIDTMKVVRQVSLISNLGLRNNSRTTITGFQEYHLNRTSNVYTKKAGLIDYFHSCKGESQETINAKYQVSTQFYLNHVEGREELYDDTDPLRKLTDPDINPAESVLEQREYNLHFNCCGKNAIQAVSLRYILLSKSASLTLRQTFSELQVLPFIKYSGDIKGSTLSLRSNDLTICNLTGSIQMLDQNFNNVYQYQNKTLQFGVQKYQVNPNNANDMLVIVSVQMRKQIYQGEYLDLAESFWVQSKIIKKLLSQNQAKFESYLFNDDFDILQKEEFYKSQEVLQGRSINDITLLQSNEVAQGLALDEEQYSNIKGSLIEEISYADDKYLNSYLTMQLYEKSMLIQMDFNFCSTLRFAAELNVNKSVELILEKIFDVNSIAYQDIFMLELPVQLKMPRIERLYDFLHRDYKEAKQIEKENQKSLAHGDQLKSNFLNFEDFLNHPFLPPFMSTRENYLPKENFKDFHNYENEIIMEIVNKYPYMTWNVKNFKDQDEKRPEANNLKNMKKLLSSKEEKNIEVEHSAIDFQRTIIGEKLRAIEETEGKPEKIHFNDKHLSDIFMIEDDENIEFYNCDAVRKVVDFQFNRTKSFMLGCFVVYMGGFMIPYLMTLSIKNQVALNIFYFLCMFTQIIFMFQEVAQLKQQKLDYFKDTNNLLESSQFAFFTLLFLIKMGSQFQSDTFIEIILQSILLVQSFNKVFYFLNMWDSLAFILKMASLLIADTLPYLIMVLILMMSICMQFTSLHIGVSDPNKQFVQIDSKFMQLMIQIYRSNKGDVNVPALDGQMTARVSDTPFMGYFVFSLNIIVWLFQQLSFIFIAAIFTWRIMVGYEKFYKQMPQRLYQNKAKLNCENFDIMDNFFANRKFKVICFSFDKKLKWEVYEQWWGTVHKIENQLMIQNFEEEFVREEHEEILDQRQTQLKKTKEVMDELFYQVRALNKYVAQSRRCCCGYDQQNPAPNNHGQNRQNY